MAEELKEQFAALRGYIESKFEQLDRLYDRFEPLALSIQEIATRTAALDVELELIKERLTALERQGRRHDFRDDLTKLKTEFENLKLDVAKLEIVADKNSGRLATILGGLGATGGGGALIWQGIKYFTGQG